MSLQSPNVILYDGYGTIMPVQNGTAIPSGTSALLLSGSDGTTARTILTDATGKITVVGTGNFTNASVSAVAAAPPASATYFGGSVTTASPTYTTGQMDPLSLTTAGALRVDGSATTQPISGTVTANQGGTWTVQPGNTANTTPWLATVSQGGNSAAVKAASTAPVAADPALVVTISPNSTMNVSTDGYVTTAAPVYTNNTLNYLSLTTTGLLRVDGSAVTQPVSGTITANIGTSGSLALDATVAKLTIAQSTALGTNTQAMVGGSVTTAAPTYTTGNINPLSLTTTGNLRTQTAAESATAAAPPALAVYAGGSVTTNAPTYTTGQMNALSLTTAGALRIDGYGTTQVVTGNTAAGSGASTNLVTVQGNAGGTPIPVSGSFLAKSSTGTITAVAGNTASFTLLASNANRVSASFYNATNRTLYVAMAATASTVAYTIQVAVGAFFELSISYTGIITAISTAGVTGNILCTEYSV